MSTEGRFLRPLIWKRRGRRNKKRWLRNEASSENLVTEEEDE
jgi:hypothetical protein